MDLSQVSEISRYQTPPNTQGKQPQPTSSCAECRRRRVKCDGRTIPCKQCAYYLVPHLCHYPARKRRQNVTLKSYTELSEAYSKAQKVINTLFPSSSLTELSSMTRLQLLERLKACAVPQRATGDFSHSDLHVLEPHAEQNFTWDEVSEDESETSRVADDVNGLAFSKQTPHASYLGLSSVPTILKVITHLRPDVQRKVPQGPEAWRSPSLLGASPDESFVLQVDETSLVDAYFDFVHPSVPMIDEAEFRCRYGMEKVRRDETSPWLALLNMVLAMGSMASDSIHFASHNVFYKRALLYLNMTSFGSGHIYMVQALALYSGMALHFFNQPNTAIAVMGATIQMAVAMGLHRVQAAETNEHSPCYPTTGTASTRIRTWWTLLCLDTWASSTLGRPSPGYWNLSTVSTSIPSTLGSSDFEIISLTASEDFCRIAARIQERLIQLPLITLDEVEDLDRDLTSWKNSLHTFLAHREQCPSSLKTARAIMWWRYITTRLTLYRPALLVAAIRQRQWDELSTNEKASLRTCLETAIAGIDMMSMEWSPNQFICWNIAWNLFQVTLVVILFMMSYKDLAEEYNCSEYVIHAIELFGQMEPLDAGCTRSRKLIQLLFNNARDLESETFLREEAVGSQSLLDTLDFDLLGEDVDWVMEFCGGN
ncbi:lactose regulatory protein lac9 [Fusarium langsethiae]|uniref:Lactose regulatory protein lac9 n=1 Tax=Fusarium langsethiae TaxID=179993 RepID=A0A0M9EVX9_FUSLA|nr:lactose regulatory protein lac9 [Fusarium langsethiae]GKU03581.1 unnamed protein product [Fusarium langsethiae]GKU21455.1 unnamed protein product [Fusarium langsethiae]